MKKILFFASLFIGLIALLSAHPEAAYEIRGQVLDQRSGLALEAAEVKIKGTEKVVKTARNGNFRLQSPTPCATLIVSLPGYQTTEISKACAGQTVVVRLQQAGTKTKEAADEYIYITDPETYETRKMKLSSGRIYVPAPLQGQAPAHSTIGYDPGTVHNTEDYALIRENRFHRATDEPLSTFSIDVDAASYSNLRRFLRNGQLPPKDAVRIEEMVNYFTYDYSQPKGEAPFSVTTEISDCPWAPAHRLLHIGLQGKKIPMDDLPASNLVFLLDVSGSMNAPNKLPLLKSAFKLLTDQLRPQDKVAIVVYAGAAGVVLEPTAGDDHQAIKDALEKLEAEGSTAGAAGIQLAYNLARKHFVEGGNNRVILATDGDFNVGTSSDAELVRLIEEKRESGIFLTVLGFGMGNYKDNKMQQLANKGNGNHAYIDDIQEARKVLVEEFGGTVFAIAKDVKLQIEFNPAEVAGYRLIGYENRLLKKEDFNDDAKDAGELGSGHTVTALYELIPAGVESAFLADVDELKYQTPKTDRTARRTGEMATVKLRYKKPDGDTSKLLEVVVKDGGAELEKSSENFRWSAAVAGFGMLLRESDFKGNSTYQAMISLAEGAKGRDERGYRAECIRMMETVRDLQGPEVAGKE